MKPKETYDYPKIEALVERAKLQRTAYVADLISSGLAAIAHGVTRVFGGATSRTPKRRLATR